MRDFSSQLRTMKDSVEFAFVNSRQQKGSFANANAGPKRGVWQMRTFVRICELWVTKGSFANANIYSQM